MTELRPLSRSEVRRVDQIAIDEYGMSGLVLMENAGRGCAEAIDRASPRGKVVILCGGGNNGGDGFVIARHLQLCGREVETFCIADATKLSPDAAANYTINEHAGLTTRFLPEGVADELRAALDDAAVVVDALLGTGAKGDPRPPMDGVIELANAADAMRVAVDIPSGLDCDSGAVGSPCFCADHTCTFVAPKIGFGADGAQQYAGDVHVIAIGVPLKLLRDLEVTAR